MMEIIPSTYIYIYIIIYKWYVNVVNFHESWDWKWSFNTPTTQFNHQSTPPFHHPEGAPPSLRRRCHRSRNVGTGHPNDRPPAPGEPFWRPKPFSSWPLGSVGSMALTWGAKKTWGKRGGENDNHSALCNWRISPRVGKQYQSGTHYKWFHMQTTAEWWGWLSIICPRTVRSFSLSSGCSEEHTAPNPGLVGP